MALEKNFYNEIHENEQKWSEYINEGLLPAFYCEHELKPFYLKKLNSLIKEDLESKNLIVQAYITDINNIIKQIDLLYYKETHSQEYDIKSLLPLFLISQMNISKEEVINNLDIDRLIIKKSIILAEKNNIERKSQEIPDYLYEDFLEETETKKH